MDDTEYGTKVLRTYYRQIKNATKWTLRYFSRSDGSSLLDFEEVEQQARLLVLSYAGVIPSVHSGKLHYWQRRFGKGRHYGWVCKQLKEDLRQHYNRVLRTEPHFLSLDRIPLTKQSEDSRDPYRDPRDRTINHLDFKAEEPRLRDEYPYLMLLFDAYNEYEIASQLGVCRRTVIRHLQEERERASHDEYVQQIAGFNRQCLRLAT